MTVGSRLRVEAVYLNAVQAASRAGIRFFATSEWVTLAPELLTDSLALAEGLDEGVTLGGAFPSTFLSPTTLARGTTPVVAPVAAPVAASPVVPVEEPASPDFPPVSPAFSEGPPPTPTPVPTPAPTISREPSSKGWSSPFAPSRRPEGGAKLVLSRRCRSDLLASGWPRRSLALRMSRCLHCRAIRRERALRGAKDTR